ncbi:MAG TPA: phage integrase SAM-like domain and Arm DNA-binding domain-containing protein, partial [Chryseolinea sp.]|nr:phage integrase SAM-like domain and Arm DNA-binding domain-containing protein [Chryseolinea sp.]
MQNTYSVISYLKRERRVRNKLASVLLRITVKGQRAEISIKRRVSPERWEAKENRVKGNKEDAREINCLIENLILKINKIYSRLIESDEIVTASRIKQIFLGNDEKKQTLLKAFIDHNAMMGSRVGIDFSQSTYTRYKTTYDHLREFLKHQYNIEDIPLQSVRYSFITDLEHFLKVTRKCNHNSTQKYIRNFRKIINNAIKNDWLDKDPFKAYRVKLRDTKRVFLT